MRTQGTVKTPIRAIGKQYQAPETGPPRSASD